MRGGDRKIFYRRICLRVMEEISYTNERHKEALVRASESLTQGIELLEMCEPLEIAEIEARDAFQILGEIIGETANEEILDTVFSKFCLGK